jgi:hypothetical protein
MKTRPERNRVFDLSRPAPGALASAMVRACYGSLVPKEMFAGGSVAEMEEFVRPLWRARIWELHDLHAQFGRLASEQRAVYCLNCPPVGFQYTGWPGQPCGLKFCPYCRARTLVANLWNKVHDSARWPKDCKYRGYRDDRRLAVVRQTKQFDYAVTEQEVIDAWRLHDQWRPLSLPRGVLARMTTDYITVRKTETKTYISLVKKSCFLLARHVKWPAQETRPSRSETLEHKQYLPDDETIVSATVFATRYPRAWLDGTIAAQGLDGMFSDATFQGRKDTRWSGIWHGKKVYLA